MCVCVCICVYVMAGGSRWSAGCSIQKTRGLEGPSRLREKPKQEHRIDKFQDVFGKQTSQSGGGSRSRVCQMKLNR